MPVEPIALDTLSATVVFQSDALLLEISAAARASLSHSGMRGSREPQEGIIMVVTIPRNFRGFPKTRVSMEDKLKGDSPKFRQVWEGVRLVAPSSAAVLIRGETGTVRKRTARGIHELSSRNGASCLPRTSLLCRMSKPGSARVRAKYAAV